MDLWDLYNVCSYHKIILINDDDKMIFNGTFDAVPVEMLDMEICDILARNNTLVIYAY